MDFLVVVIPSLLINVGAVYLWSRFGLRSDRNFREPPQFHLVDTM